MKRFRLCFLIAILLLPAAWAEVSSDILTLGDTFPDFSVELCDGSVFTLSEALTDHDAVMINIWASWCNPCCREFPYMDEAYAAYSDSVAVVCLSPYDQNADVAAFREEHELGLPMGYDSVGFDDLLGTKGYPTTVMIDRYGNYAYYEVGAMPSTEAFTEMFEMFLGEDYTPVVYADYEIVLVDTDGAPVAGCVIDVCTEESCMPITLTAGGILLTGEAYPYSVHVLTVPEGYTCDPSEEYTLEAAGDKLTITIRKSE